MVRRIGFAATVASVAASAVLMVSSAQGATDLGQLGNDFGCGGADYTEIQTATGGAPRYDAPMDGVISSWSIEATSTTNVVVRLKMFRPTSAADQFTLIGESSDQGPLTPNAVNGPFPTSIPVKAGDLLGVYVVAGDGYGCLFNAPNAGDVAREVNPDHSVVGETVTTTNMFSPTRVNVAATLIPPTIAPTGQRAAALKKCKKKHSKRARKKCRKKAKRLPV